MGLCFVPFPGPSHSVDQVFGERGHCDLLPLLSLLLIFVGVQLVHLLRQMLTVQNPKKSWLATKPAGILVDDASLGLQSPPSLPLGFLGVQPAHLLRWMLTVQNPKKSWLAMKPACSFVDNTSLGLRLPPSGFGCPCLSLEGDGLVCSQLALLSPLFCEWAWWCLRLGLFVW